MMATQKILMPYNFTAHEEKALDFIVNTFAHREDVKITLLNTYAPLPKIDTAADPVLYRMRNSISYLSEDIRQKEAGLKSVKEYFLENGFSDDQVDYIFKEREKSIVGEIIDAVSKGRYRVLVLSRQSGKVTRLFARSLHSRALQALKNVTICIAT
jgi:hypothetical protein